MKLNRIFLTTTALVALAAGSALAEGPTVMLGGKVDFQAGVNNQQKDKRTNAAADIAADSLQASRRAKFQHTTQVSAKVNGKTDFGLGYGALAVIEANKDKSGNQINGDVTNVKRSLVFVESNMGRLEAGSSEGAAYNMRINAAKLARASGGIDGDWNDHVIEKNLRPGTYDAAGAFTAETADALANDSYEAAYITKPSLFLDYSANDRKANKVTYYTPRFAGLQLGASFIPDSGNNGTNKGFTTKYDGTSGNFRATQVGNAFSLGANYMGQFDMFGISLSATGELGDAEHQKNVAVANKFKNLRTYELGGQISYANFAVSGSYGDWGRSLTRKGVTVARSNTRADFWNAGASYVQGPVGLSVTYLESSRYKNKFNNVVVGGEYQLAPGLVPYLEASFFNYKSRAGATNAAAKLDGNVVLGGLFLVF